MSTTLRTISRRLFGPIALLSSVLLAASCGSNNSNDFRLETRATGHPCDPSLPIAVAGRWVVYMALESADAGGTDLNGDGDTSDSVAIAVDIVKRREYLIGSAAREAAIVGNQVFLVTDELQNLPEGASLAPDAAPFRLARWHRSLDAPESFDALPDSPGTQLHIRGDRIYYASAATPSGPNESTLRFVDRDAPTSPIVVRSAGGQGRLPGVPVEMLDGLLLVKLRESNAPSATGDWPDKDLNGDGDQDDEVLAMLDATDPGARLLSTELAVTGPVDARLLTDVDWLVAFLVDEEGQGADLNDPALFDPAWVAEACAAPAADGVQAGQAVLHYTRMRDLEAGDAPVNTGLVGASRVVALSDAVATLSPEADAGCDLNGDGDTDDTVARWTAAVPVGDLVLPPGAIAELHAVDLNAGPSMGLSSVSERLVLIVDEAADARDIDGDGVERFLVASRDPLDPLETEFVFEHRSGIAEFDEKLDEFVTTQPFVGGAWMDARPSFGRLAMTCDERVAGETLNRNDLCDDVAKDPDLADVVAVWPRVRSTSERASIEADFPLTFPGLGYALQKNNPGVVLEGGLAMVRVSEQADRRDHNEDGDRDDVVLVVNPLAGCRVSILGDATLADGPVAFSDGQIGAAFPSDETLAGIDLDGDGDALDIVVQYFRF